MNGTIGRRLLAAPDRRTARQSHQTSQRLRACGIRVWLMDFDSQAGSVGRRATSSLTVDSGRRFLSLCKASLTRRLRARKKYRCVICKKHQNASIFQYDAMGTAAGRVPKFKGACQALWRRPCPQGCRAPARQETSQKARCPGLRSHSPERPCKPRACPPAPQSTDSRRLRA